MTEQNKIVAATLREMVTIWRLPGNLLENTQKRADELDPVKSKADRIVEEWNKPFGYGPSVTNRLLRILKEEGIE